ncbi:DNA-binding protein [Thermomonas sp. HDW16]|uniref:DNA-binding protein n=1 Tax=Thermomonas sp. HDW16 TaxID=2714945 RepID=UPI001409F9D0|nr:DNA-binding protein [Thermomonas sp. HDW16]QIL20204.1 hypothetical protein G7079_05305 [Thermomonas sp. HDW16]
MAISKEQVWQAADSLVAEDRKPTHEAIRSEIGQGSFSTIQKWLVEWRDHKAVSATSSKTPVPDVVVQALTRIGNEVWASASSAAEARIAVEREALAEARRDLETDVAEAMALADRLDQELARSIGEISTLKMNEQRWQSMAGELEKQLAVETALRAENEQRMMALKDEVHALRTTTQQAMEKVADLIARRETLETQNAELISRIGKSCAPTRN